MNNQSNIEHIVMRRVRLIRFLALVISTGTFAALTFIAALWDIGKEVWVARIFENAPSAIGDLPAFYVAAFLHTHLIVQILSALTLLSLILLVREAIRLIAGFFTSISS